MRVLVACEFSGVVRDAFLCAGHDAWSCDLLPCDRGGPHYQCDVREVWGDGWDLAVMHPDCTYLTNSGVRWLHTEAGRWQKLIEAAAFFRECLDAPIPRIAVENPIPHKYARQIIGRRYTQIIQPWQHGHPESKATCLWLKNLPPLVPSQIVPGRAPRVHHESPGPDRWKRRARTLEGIATAMADQWGGLLVREADQRDPEPWWKQYGPCPPEVRKALLGDIMEHIRGCDEKKDADGFCSCAHFIGNVLAHYEGERTRLVRLVDEKLVQQGNAA